MQNRRTIWLIAAFCTHNCSTEVQSATRCDFPWVLLCLLETEVGYFWMSVASVVRQLLRCEISDTCSLYVMFNRQTGVSAAPFEGARAMDALPRHTPRSRARITLDIIFYLLLILFTSRCQFEWQVAEHFRVCLPASTWACQSLTAIHSVYGREAAPRWFAAVCLSWKCSASAGQERKRKGGGGDGVLMDLSQPGV